MLEELIRERELSLVFKILSKLLVSLPIPSALSFSMREGYEQARRNGWSIPTYNERVEEIIKYLQEEGLVDPIIEDLIKSRVGRVEAKRILCSRKNTKNGSE